MSTTLLQWPEVILGAEDDDQEDSQDSSTDESQDDADQSNEDDTDEPDELQDSDREELLKAIRRERELRKEREKEARANAAKVRQFEQAQRDADLAEQGELAQAQAKLQEAETRNEQLMNGIRRDRVNRAIEKAAEKHRFIDVDDALSQVNRSDIEITDDEEDLFIVNQASVETAVKALATKKPHLVRVGTDDGEPSGSSFNTKGKKKSSTSDEELTQKYSALGR